VSSIRSCEVAPAEGSGVRRCEDALKALDFGNSLFGVHSVLISNMNLAIVKRTRTCRTYMSYLLRKRPAPSGSQRFLRALLCSRRYEAYHLDMRRLHREYFDPESSDRSSPADILLREEPEDEEEEDEEEDGDDRKEDDDADDGYSE
jgi:hypothetical protein